jgi:MoxR-like ATPase
VTTGLIPVPKGRFMTALTASIDETLLSSASYLGDRSLASPCSLRCVRMGRPNFLEGRAAVGKTEIAKVLSAILGR